MVAQDNNTRFGSMRLAIAVRLDNEDAHGRNTFWDLAGAFQPKIFLLGNASIYVVIDEALLLLVVAIEPDLSVGIVRMNGFSEGRWAGGKQILGGDVVGGRSRVSGLGLQKRANLAVARNENVFAAQCRPCALKVREWDGPVNLEGSSIAAYIELEAAARGVRYVPLVVDAFLI